MHDDRSDGRAEIKRCYVGADGRRRIAERENKLSLAPFARSSATPCRLFRVYPRPSHPRPPCLARHGSRQCRQPLPILSPCAHPSSPAARRSRARSRTRALRARVRHFSFFAFTASPLCHKPLSDSRFGVKAFPKMLHRGEASAPHPPSDCNRPPNDRSTRTHPGARTTKSPLQNAERRGQLHQGPRPRW